MSQKITLLKVLDSTLQLSIMSHNLLEPPGFRRLSSPLNVKQNSDLMRINCS